MNNCEWCQEKKANGYNNQGDLVCNDCEKESNIKCNFCDNKAEHKSQIHNNINICNNDNCKENYLTSYCIENILN